MGIKVDLEELLGAGILTEEKAAEIRNYYEEREAPGKENRLLVIFGVLGATLVGLGIILILAHNWDQFPRGVKTLLAFAPLLLGQGVCLYALLRKPEQAAWRETGATVLLFGVGASIALVSQIYNLPGGTAPFLLTWILLCLPLVYIMRSSFVSLLCLAGLTYYVALQGYGRMATPSAEYYWPLLLALLPYYYLLFRKNPKSNALTFHHWMLPISIAIAWGGWMEDYLETWIVAAFSALFGLFYLLGSSPFFKGEPAHRNAYKIIGSLGMVGLLLLASSTFFWEAIFDTDHLLKLSDLLFGTLSGLIVLLANLLGILFFSYMLYRKNWSKTQPLILAPALILLLLLAGVKLNPGTLSVIVNFALLGIGVYTIVSGTRLQHLGVLNYGLLIITALVACRFFDTNIGFVIKGLLFLIVGLGFFFANYWTLKKRKENEA